MEKICWLSSFVRGKKGYKLDNTFRASVLNLMLGIHTDIEEVLIVSNLFVTIHAR